MKDKQITKIVITGGPCGGKTTAMDRIQKAFVEMGYSVVFVPETATELILGGITPFAMKNLAEFQLCLLKLQLKKEEIYVDAASKLVGPEKVLVVCDRGALDCKAYMTGDDFNYVLSESGHSEIELRDKYDAVFHLVTAAKGAEEAYTLSNNKARTETIQQATEMDDKLICAWTGHPHFRIIDNSRDFEGKIQCLISEISVFLGEKEL